MNNLNAIDFNGIEQAAKPNISNLLERILPGGKHAGKHYKCADINGGAGKSFSYNTENDRWADFAKSDISGKGIIALVAMQKNIGQSEAAKFVADLAGYKQENASLRNNLSRVGNQETCKSYKGKLSNGEPDLSDSFFARAILL